MLCASAGRPTRYTASDINDWAIQLLTQQWRYWVCLWAGRHADWVTGEPNQGSLYCSGSGNQKKNHLKIKYNVAGALGLELQQANESCTWHLAGHQRRCTTLSPQQHLLPLQQEALHLPGFIIAYLMCALIIQILLLNHIDENRPRSERCFTKLSFLSFT